MSEYRVTLDIYNGPLDLLLYLIRRDEVDIYDIPIAGITRQYVAYVEMLHQVDPDLAGEFMVMAATLLELKTRMLLPNPPPEEGGGDSGVSLDPRSELVRQLLQYKAFKDAADTLRHRAEDQAMKFPRRPPGLDGPDALVDLENVQIWDLLDAFNKVLTAIGQDRQHEVIYDDTPVELYAADLYDRLQREGPLNFQRLFEGQVARPVVVGLFLALLELVRQKKVLATQDGMFGEIHLFANPNPPEERPAGFAAEEAPAAAQNPTAPAEDEPVSAEPPAEPAADAREDDEDDFARELNAINDTFETPAEGNEPPKPSAS